VFGRHSTDQALALALGHRDHEAGGVFWFLAWREHDLWNAAATDASKVEARSPAQLFELEQTQLRERLVLGELARDEATEDVFHRPARTSRMRRQWVPAQ
jgi:hypothetical protein